MIENIEIDGKLYAIIVRNNYQKEGVNFFTPNNFSQQLAYMCHAKGKQIEPHIHNPVRREVLYTQEVLIIKKGKLRVDIYTQEQEYLVSKTIEAGDIILLAQGGHGFEVLDELEMFEIKQGPYAGDKDKTRFKAKAVETT